MKHYQMGPRMSQAVVWNGAVHIAGQVAENRKAGIEAQTRDVLAKIDALLAEVARANPASWRSMSSCRTSPISRR